MLYEGVRQEKRRDWLFVTDKPGDFPGFGYGYVCAFRKNSHVRMVVGGQVGFADPDRGLSFAFVCNGQRQPRFMVWRYNLGGLALQSCRN